MNEYVCKTKRKEATRRLNALMMLNAIIETGAVGKCTARRIVAKKYGFSVTSLYSYQKMVEGLDQKDWFFALFPAWSSPGFKKFEIPKAAWDIFKACFLTAKKPCLDECYDRLKRISAKRGWLLPHKKTFYRRIRQEIALNLISRPRK